MVHPWRTQDVPDSGIDKVILSGTLEQGLKGEAMAQELVVNQDPQKQIKLQKDTTRNSGSCFYQLKFSGKLLPPLASVSPSA